MNAIFSARTIKAAFFVGTLDILAACIHFYLKTNKGPLPVLKFIASGAFGKEAFTAGNSMVLYGLLFHYFIAFIFTIFFFWVCHKFPSVLNWKYATGIVYGIFIWTVMNFLVLPFSNAPKMPFNLTSATTSLLILILCIGMPLALMASLQSNKR